MARASRNTRRPVRKCSPGLPSTCRPPSRRCKTPHWDAVETSDAARGGLNLPLKEVLAGLDTRWQELEQIHQQAVTLLQQRGHWDEFPEASPPGVLLEKQPGRRFCHALEQAQAQFRTLSKQWLPQVFRGVRPLGFVLVLWLLAAYPCVAIFGGRDWRWAAVSGGFAVVVSIVAGTWIHYVARRKSVEAFLALRRTLMEAGLGRPGVLEAAKADCQRMDALIIGRHRTQTHKADEEFAATKARIERRKQNDLQRIEATYPQKLADLVAWRDRVQAEIEAKYPPLLEHIERTYRSESQRLGERLGPDVCRQPAALRARVVGDGRALADGRGATSTPRPNNSAWPARRRFPIGTRTTGAATRGQRPFRPSFASAAARSGWPRSQGGVPEDPRLRPTQLDFTLPALLPYPRRSLLLLKTSGPGRARADRPDASRDAPPADGHAAGQGPFHDRRSGGTGRQFFRLHEPGRFRRAVGGQPHLDRQRPHRAAFGRPDEAHGKRHPGLSPQGIPFDRGIQRLCRRNGRTVPGAGGGQLPGQLFRSSRAAYEEYRRQRRPVRRVRAHERGYAIAPAAQLPVIRLEATPCCCVGTRDISPASIPTSAR